MADEIQYKDRVIHVKYRKGLNEVTIEGVCTAHNPKTAFLVKVEKKAIPELVPIADVISVSVVERVEQLKAVKLREVKPYEVRRHLLNYHGILLSEINVWTDDEAFDIHAVLHDKQGDDIAHFHSNDK